MTPPSMTSAEFRAAYPNGITQPARKSKSKAVHGPWHTRCRTCGHESTTEASQERHCTSEKHPTYEVVLTLKEKL